MKINKIVILAVFAIFAVGAAIGGHLWNAEKHKAQTEAAKIAEQKIISVEKVIELKSQTYKRIISDYSKWDEIVEFIRSKDHKWAMYNIDTIIDDFEVSGACIIDENGSLVYGVYKNGAQIRLQELIDKNKLNFEKAAFYKFYAKTEFGIAEVHGGSIHKTDDINRSEKPKGYLFVAKALDGDYIREIEPIVQGSLRLKDKWEAHNLGKYELCKNITLNGQNGEAVGSLHVSSQNQTAKTLDAYAEKTFAYMSLVAVLTLMALIALISKYVSRPLSAISKALNSKEPALIAQYASKKDEYGQIASLMIDFFKAQQELEALNQTLQKRVDEEVAKNREQEMILYQKSKAAAMGEMINNIAHQWRQPINTISIITGKLELARQKNSLTNETLRLSIQKVQTLTYQMSNTIEDFKNFFKPNKEKSEFSLLEKLQESAAIAKDGYGAVNVNIIIDCDPNLTVFGYKGELAQTFLACFENSKDAILEKNKERGGTITVQAKTQDKSVLITICDNGGGVSEEILKRIFQPFFTTKSDNKGSGVGLYMAKQIVEFSMGGKISAHNKEEGLAIQIELPPFNANG